ncbi:MAG: M14 family metallopeptidase [Phycisphaerae bacterium]
MATLITLDADDISLQAMWDMGADDFALTGGVIQWRVSAPMLAALDAQGVAYTVVDEDVYATIEALHLARTQTRDVSFAAYHSPSAVFETMAGIVIDHPDIAAVERIGTSVEGRGIMALRISDDAQTIDPTEPGMVVTGCHHAREWISVEVPLFFANYLVENYLKDDAVTRLIRNTEIWIIPILNPDGFEYSWGPDRLWRKNRRDNGDGTFGVDPNRNYSVGFGGSGASDMTFSQVYHGPQAFSEPETQAIRDLFEGGFGRTFASGLSYHNFSQLVMYPNGYTTEPADNAAFLHQLAGGMTNLINAAHTNTAFDYEFGQTSLLLYIASGVFTDWVDSAMGLPAIIVELRPAGGPFFFELPADQIVPTALENLPAFLHMAEETMVPGLAAQDADLDGFVDGEDLCPGTPVGETPDASGCSASQQDVDGDGVPYALDLCPDSLPQQQVDAEGCRVPTLFTVSLASNISSVEIGVSPPDIDAAGGASIGTMGFTRAYAEPSTIVLDAPAVSGGSIFSRWLIDGEPRMDDGMSIAITTAVDVEAQVVYVFPESVDIAGSSRIPDRTSDDMPQVFRYSARVVYSDSSVRTPDADVQWELSDPSVALVTADGELLPFDVAGEVGEATTVLSASVDFGGLVLTANPLEVAVFDARTRSPWCESLTIGGPDTVASNTERSYTASVLFQGEPTARTRPDGVIWRVAAEDGSTTGDPPATISDDGLLRAGWVAVDTTIAVHAVFPNDNGTECTVEKTVVISAGDPGDSAARVSPFGAAGACGAAGMLVWVGSIAGLICVRSVRGRRRRRSQ